MVGSQHFEDAVRRLSEENEVPHLTEEFIAKYLDDMRRLGLIPPASVGVDDHSHRAMSAAARS